MKKLIPLLCTLFLSFSISILFAQYNDPGEMNQREWNKPYEWPWEKGSRPFIEANYGYGLPRQKLFQGEFANYGYAEVKLGYSRISKFRSIILDLDERFVFGNFSSQELNEFDDQVAGEVKTEMTRFGMANRLGYGYKLWILSILPYSQTQFTFTRLDSERPANLSQTDIDILDRYEGSYRFGNAMEAGIKAELFKSIAVVGSYEAAVIYPRVVFFPWLGGVMAQTFALEAISYFAEDIVSSSNLFGPLMYAVLRNGAAYLLYQGMRDKMYWPFNSETPLTHETIKLGVSLTF